MGQWVRDRPSLRLVSHRGHHDRDDEFGVPPASILCPPTGGDDMANLDKQPTAIDPVGIETMRSIARRMFDLVEPIGVVPYATDEAHETMFALGFTNYWDTYFAGRAAPL